MACTHLFAHGSRSVVNPKVEDYYPSGKRFLLRFKEKGGKEKELPVHHKLEEVLDGYLKATGLGTEPGSPLFPAALGKTGKLSRRSLVRTDAADMLKRRLKQAGLEVRAYGSPYAKQKKQATSASARRLMRVETSRTSLQESTPYSTFPTAPALSSCPKRYGSERARPKAVRAPANSLP
jgi:hypothetical protein